LSLIYRLLRKRFARAPFDGEGAYLYGGRWSSPGTRLSYASEHQSLAMLEYFVHLDQDDLPDDLVLASAEAPEALSRERINIKDLPVNWRDIPAPAELAKYGDDFARRAETCLLIVPSALAPGENNVLISPAHPDARRIIARELGPFRYDRG
jgi:RES domain-containing protein